jgi:hypothetical protein
MVFITDKIAGELIGQRVHPGQKSSAWRAEDNVSEHKM